MSRYFTPEEQKEHTKRSIQGGIKGAAIVGLAGGAISIAGHRYSQAYRQLALPMKGLLLASVTGAGAIWGSDVASQAYQKEKFAWVEADKPVYSRSQKSITTRGIGWVLDNRWGIIAGSWATAMAGSLAYSFSKKTLTTTQKFYHARVYAQAVTLAVLMASAGLSFYAGEDKHGKHKEDPDEALRAVLELPTSQKQHSNA